CGLDQMLFCEFLEEQGQDVSLLMTLFVFHMVLFCQFSGLLQGFYLVPVHTRIFLHCVHHGDPFKRLAQIHLHTIINDFGGSQHFLCHITVQILCQIHHSVVICISLV